ncbi:putative cytosol aminopeptidase [Azospirillaceae bacterium]
MNISFMGYEKPNSGTLVLCVAADRQLGAIGQEIDRLSGGALERAMLAARFVGKKEEILTLLAPAGLTVSRITLIGLGKPEAATLQTARAAGGALLAAIQRNGDSEATIVVDMLEGVSVVMAEFIVSMAVGLRLRAYRFDKYRTKEKSEQKPTLASVRFQCLDDIVARQAAALFLDWEPVIEGVFLTRDLVAEPANVIYPESFAQICHDVLTPLGVEVEILESSRLRELGMGALLGVAQGSANTPRVVVMNYRGDSGVKDHRPLALVGKGVTFDSGGLSLKPPSGMEEMKMDMSGAGVVLGLLRALAGRKARVNVVGVIGLVENMPSGVAQRPGDVVRSMSGQTIEVLNTDAEGRLVLADILTYTQRFHKPQAIIDLATLTGAVVIALGVEHAGLFSNDDALAEKLMAAGKSGGELLWRLPLGDAYDKEINSDIADMKNTGGSRNAGSIIGAQFLQRFIESDTPWAHIDIAGVAWTKKDLSTVPKGSSGFGVQLLDRLIRSSYEAKDI